MSKRFCFSLVTLVSLSSCTGLPLGRSYLSDFEQEDTGFFGTERPFPVVSGDTEERGPRALASEEDILKDRSAQILKRELKSLEALQPEQNLELYTQYRDKFRNDSERIYFLKLPARERRDYLIARGFMKDPTQDRFTANDRQLAVRRNDILLGMSKNDVMESLGKPLRVEIAGNPRYENERWLYRLQGYQKFIYFESGKVEGWE